MLSSFFDISIVECIESILLRWTMEPNRINIWTEGGGFVEEHLDRRCNTKMHALVTCREAQKVWFASSLSLRFHNLNFDDFKQWVEFAIDITDEDSRAMVSAILWAIWYIRNRLVFQNRRMEIQHVLSKMAPVLPSGKTLQWLKNQTWFQPIRKHHHWTFLR